MLLESDGTGAVLTSYTLGNGQLISQTRSGTTSYYLPDGQGSTRALADSAGAITDTYNYTAFGELHNQTGSTTNNYLYTGQQFDAATGQYYLRARYYQPGVGRFISRDSAALLFSNPIELNRYGYVANNPINLSDPSGQQALTERVEIDVNVTGGVYRAVSWAELQQMPVVWQAGTTQLVSGGQLAAGVAAILAILIGILLIPSPAPTPDPGPSPQPAPTPEPGPIPTPSPSPQPQPQPQPSPAPPAPTPTPDDDCDAPPWTDWVAPYAITGDATGQVHHIATNKHTSVWTPLFANIFVQANLTLETDWNKIRLEGHAGRHSTVYHQYTQDFRLF